MHLSEFPVYLNFPAILGEMMPFDATSESAKVVLPWSTWAIIQMLRIFEALLCSSESFLISTSLMMNTWIYLKHSTESHGLQTA